MRMTRENFGAECKICSRPYTLFKWQAIKGIKPRRTEICGSCSRLKNCCQTCMLDLQFGIPLAIRDAALKMIKQAPSSDINREYYAQNHENSTNDAENADRLAVDLLRKLAKSEPYFHRSRPDINEQEAKQIYQQTKDTQPALFHKSRKGKIKLSTDLTSPAEKTICSFFLLGVDDDLHDYKIKEYFEQFGKVKSVVCSHRARCAFVNYCNRADAEEAAKAHPKGELAIENHPLKMQWSRPRPIGTAEAEAENQRIAALALQTNSTHKTRLSDPDSEPDTLPGASELPLPAGSSYQLYPSQQGKKPA